MQARLPAAGELDALGAERFVEAVAPLFEGASEFAARLAMDRPFGSYEALLERAEVVALAMPEPEQIALLDAHPRIGAPPGDVSALSFQEQGYAGEASEGSLPAAATTDREVAREELARRLERLNAGYEERYGFRYVVHVAGRSRAEIAGLLEQRSGADREAEKQRALRDVVAIARARLRVLRGVENGT